MRRKPGTARPPVRIRALLSSVLVGLIVAVAGSVGSGAASRARAVATGPVNTALPAVVGSALEGATVAASTGVWSGSTPIVFTYQWQRCDASGAACDPIADATSPLYTLTPAEVGQAVRVVVTATNTGGAATATSPASAKVTAAPANAPRNTSAPTISGTARQGETLAASSGSWNGATPIAFAYQWQRCDTTGGACAAIVGASNPTYTLAAGDVNSTLRVLVGATNGSGANTALSLQTALVTAASGPVNTVAPSISGSAAHGSTLTANAGSWTGAAPISFAYQWLRCDQGGGNCGAITGASKQTYGVTSSDIGHTLRILVTATNSVGVASLLSAQTAVVSSPSGPVNTSAPGITGAARQGELLTVSQGTWTGSSPISIGYQWLRCDAEGNHCANIDGASSASYRLTVSDVNRALRVAVTASNSVGRSTVVTGRTSQVTPSIPRNTVLPSISGTAKQGSTLTANPGSWNSYTPIGFSYQWTRCDSRGLACRPIAGHIGAGQRTYTLTATDVGHRVFVQVKASNSVGPNFVNSLPTAIVAAASSPPPPSGGSTISVSSVSQPDRLQVDRIQFTPNRISSHGQTITARFHVIEASGRKSVTGALVYAVGVPFNRLSAPGETVTDRNGWATLSFRVQPTFQLQHDNLVVVFVRARKPGENPLGGISTRRLISIRVA